MIRTRDYQVDIAAGFRAAGFGVPIPGRSKKIGSMLPHPHIIYNDVATSLIPNA
jgi:hypothetical protein